MESTISLIKQLKSAKLATPSGAAISFCQGDGFYWEPKSTTVFYNTTERSAPQLLLHELGHALLGHDNYGKDIELLGIERAAWEQARQLSKQYSVPMSDDMVEASLDTYRDWLHARSLCPYCKDTGIQNAPKTYQCLSCHNTWSVNEARTCNLKRYKSK